MLHVFFRRFLKKKIIYIKTVKTYCFWYLYFWKKCHKYYINLQKYFYQCSPYHGHTFSVHSFMNIDYQTQCKPLFIALFGVCMDRQGAPHFDSTWRDLKMIICHKWCIFWYPVNLMIAPQESLHKNTLHENKSVFRKHNLLLICTSVTKIVTSICFSVNKQGKTISRALLLFCQQLQL